jgi:hypothetical protein
MRIRKAAYLLISEHECEHGMLKCQHECECERAATKNPNKCGLLNSSLKAMSTSYFNQANY